MQKEIHKLLIEWLYKINHNINWEIESSLEYVSSSLFSLYRLKLKTPIEFKNKSFKEFAIKWIKIELSKEMAETEFEGLQLLLNYRARVPFPVDVINKNQNALLIMEFIQKKGITSESKKDFILSLKNLYQHRNLNYGYDKNNYIGKLVQPNIETKSFLDFWWLSRIEPMMNIAIENGYFKNNEKNQLYKIIKNFLQEWRLEEDQARPIHGDLWSGNIIFSSEHAYLIDPSFAYSHPVQDFAMLELFGSPLSFSDYQQIALSCNFKILPQMIEFFQIYPLLVHVILFGSSYKPAIMNFINKYK